MWPILTILFVTFLGVVIIGSIMGLTSSGRIAKLEAQNRNLNDRIKTLESYRNLKRRTDAAELGDAQQGSSPIPIEPPERISEPIVEPAPDPISERVLEPVRAAAANAAPVRSETNDEDWSRVTGEETRKAPKAPKANKAQGRNLEELIGGQWSVWVGGLALLVGAVLLIRFSIEAGIFGPGARILMAAVLGIVLLLAGEWLKRSDDKIFKGKLGEAAEALRGNASVPGLLSAVGVFTLLGTSYAAHTLYGFISAPVAFACLGIISLGAMALSLRQGPLLAAIGLLASLATPLLIQTQTPNFMALVGYLLVVGFAALAVAHRTHWRWLEVGVVAGWLGWSAMSIKAAVSGQMLLWGVFLAIGFIVTVWGAERFEKSEAPNVAANENTLEGQLKHIALQPYFALGWGAIASILVGIISIELFDGRHGHSGTGYPTSTVILAVATMTALIVAAEFAKKQTAHLFTMGLMALGFMMFAELNGPRAIFSIATVIGVLLALRVALFSTERKYFDNFWVLFAIGLSLISVWVSYEAMQPLWRMGEHAVWALAYCGLFIVAAIFNNSKHSHDHLTVLLTCGAAALWALASTVELEGLPVSLALSSGAALMVAAMAFLRLPGARAGLLGLAGLVFAHAFLVQFPDTDSLSARPIFNALWAYLAVPTAILGLAGYLLHGEATETKTDGFINGLIEAAALAGLALFAVFQIRHLSNDGVVYTGNIGFEELGLQVSTGLCFTLAGLSKRFSGNQVLSKMAELISYVTLAIFALGSLLVLSPFLNGGERIEGNVLFNSLMTGWLVPSALLALCAWFARGRRPERYINILGGLSLVGGIMWVTGMVRFLFKGDKINLAMQFSDLELWTISAVWLAIGIALLAIGVWQRERAFRIASGVVIILTVLKAFLIDMAGLEGVLRALSFVGLGLVLIVIGTAYQRFWLSDNLDDESKEAA